MVGQKPQVTVYGPEVYRTIVESARDFIFIVDRKTHVLYANDWCIEILGKRRPYVVGKPLANFFAPDVYKPQKSAILKVFASGKPVSFEDRFRFNAKEYWLDTMLTPITIEGGRAQAVMGIARDITERKRLEEELAQYRAELEERVRERTAAFTTANTQLQQKIIEHAAIEESIRVSEEKYRTLVANIPGAVYRCANDRHWTMSFISDAIEEIAGYPSGDFIANRVRTFASVIHPDDRKMVNDRIQKAVGRKRPYVLEYRIVHRDGSVRWVYEKGQGIFDGGKIPLSLDGAIFDITPRVRAEEERAEQFAFVQDLIDALPSPVFYKSADGIYRGCNTAFEKYLGLTKDRIIGKTVYETSPKTMADVYHEMDTRLFTTPGVQVYETAVKRADGSTGHVIFNKATYLDKNGRVAGLVGMITDITERKIAEVKLQQTLLELRDAQTHLIQSEKLAALGRFSVGVAHEIKNPLGIILGGVEYLEGELTGGTADIRTALGKIKETTLKANEILQNLLQFARPSDLKITTVDSAELVKNALALFTYRVPKGITINARYARTRTMVSVDRNQIKQAIINILLNAVEAMPGGGTISVRTSTDIIPDVALSEPSCIIEIVDTGVGIPRNDLENIFEPFFSTKRDRRGTGLGLFVVKTIIDNNKGALIIDSEPGTGTTVRIVLPITPPPKELP